MPWKPGLSAPPIYEDTGGLPHEIPTADPRGSLASTHTRTILSRAVIGPLAEEISHRRTAVFGHIARLADNPAHLAVRWQIDASPGRLPSPKS